MATHLRGIARTLGPGEREPALLGGRRGVAEKTLRARVPAVARRGVPADGLILASEPQRRARGSGHVPTFAEAGVRAFHVNDRLVRVPQPPQGPRQALLRDRCRVELQEPLEAGARSLPLARGERRRGFV